MDNFAFDFIVIASGRKVAVEGFNRRSLDAKLSIAVTANFVNHETSEEHAVKEIAGLSKQYNMEFFKGLKEEHASHEDQLTELSTRTKERELSWQKQKQEMEDHYQQLLSEMQARIKVREMSRQRSQMFNLT